MCSQLYFLSPCTTTAGGYVQALITICNRQVWLNITTLERRDTNFPFSGLISLFNHLCDLLWGWRLGFYQHKEEDWVQIQSHIPLANRSEAEPSPWQPIGRQIDGDVVIEQSSTCATKTTEMSARVKPCLVRVIVHQLCRCPLTASPRPFTNSNSLEWRDPEWWRESRPPRSDLDGPLSEALLRQSYYFVTNWPCITPLNAALFLSSISDSTQQGTVWSKAADWWFVLLLSISGLTSIHDFLLYCKIRLAFHQSNMVEVTSL